MPETVETFRNQYRAVRTRYQELTPEATNKEFNALVRAALKQEDAEPSLWVYAAELVVLTREAEVDEIAEAEIAEAEAEYDGYMGTGMSEAAYYTAAGSAEFLY